MLIEISNSIKSQGPDKLGEVPNFLSNVYQIQATEVSVTE